MGKKIFALFFIVFISSFFLLNFVSKDTYFSEQENRILAQKPSFSWERLTSGRFTAETEDYLADQFPLKNGWVKMKGKVERAIGKKENNDVLFGEDGYLFERVPEDMARFDTNMDLVRTFADHPAIKQTYFLAVPTSIELYPEKLPRFVSSASQTKIMNDIKEQAGEAIEVIDPIKGLLTNQQASIYFKTDHHWTMRGAFIAYEEAAKQMGFQALTSEDFTTQIVSRDFQGTLYSKALAYDTAPDYIELFLLKEEAAIEVTYTDGTVAHTLFQLDFLAEKDKYAVFLGGNHSLINIKTGQTTGRKLAVIKDSYAHAFIPFLAAHFDEIHVLDLRYYKQNVYAYLTAHQLDEALFLYNIPNFMKDTNMGMLRY